MSENSGSSGWVFSSEEGSLQISYSDRQLPSLVAERFRLFSQGIRGEWCARHPCRTVGQYLNTVPRYVLDWNLMRDAAKHLALSIGVISVLCAVSVDCVVAKLAARRKIPSLGPSSSSCYM